MTTIEKIHKLAFATGWSKEDGTHPSGEPYSTWTHQSERVAHSTPLDYFNDANAVATAMTLINFGNQNLWAENLCRVIHGDFNNSITIAMLKATPAQLAESIGITVGLWENEEKQFADPPASPNTHYVAAGSPSTAPSPNIRIAYSKGYESLLGVMELAVNGTWKHIKVESAPIKDQSEKAYISAIGDVCGKLGYEMHCVRSDIELREFQAANPRFIIERRKP